MSSLQSVIKFKKITMSTVCVSVSVLSCMFSQEKLNAFQKKNNKNIETKMLLCGLLQDAFVSWLQKSAASLGHPFIAGCRFQKFAWTRFLGKVWKEELVCTPSRNETAGLVGLQVLLRRGGDPFGHLHLPLCGCNLPLPLCFFPEVFPGYGVLLCPIQLPNEPSRRNYSLALQTGSELAHSRCFMESKLLRIERDFKGPEPAVDVCGSHLFLLQQNYSKEVSIDLLSPLAQSHGSPQTPPACGQSPPLTEVALVEVSERFCLTEFDGHLPVQH